MSPLEAAPAPTIALASVLFIALVYGVYRFNVWARANRDPFYDEEDPETGLSESEISNAHR